MTNDYITPCHPNTYGRLHNEKVIFNQLIRRKDRKKIITKVRKKIVYTYGYSNLINTKKVFFSFFSGNPT